MIIEQLNSEHKQEMAKVKRENDGCQKEVEELNNRVNQLESEKKILQENLAQISNLFQKIYNPIKNSGEDNKGKDDKNNQGNKFSKGIKNSGEDNKGEDDNNQVNKFSKVIFVFRFFKIIEPFLVLIIFGLLLSLMFPRLNREDNQPSDQDDSKQSSGVDGVASIQPVSSNFEVYHCVNNEAKPDGQPVDSVEKGEWYVAKVIDGAGQDTRDWFLEGATPGNTRNDGIVSFKINSDNTVKIACISSTNSLAFLKELPVIK